MADGRTEQVPVAELQPSDLVLVRPDACIPADGTVEEGQSEVDESMVTGESRPISKEPGAAVIGGATVAMVGDGINDAPALAQAVGYNAFALPAAAGALAPFRLVLPAWVGAVLMSASTIIVAIDAQTLRRLRLKHRVLRRPQVNLKPSPGALPSSQGVAVPPQARARTRAFTTSRPLARTHQTLAGFSDRMFGV